MMGLATDDDNNRAMDNTNMENNDEIDNEDTYFNYNYSYNFAPDWINDTKDQHTYFKQSGSK